MATGSSSEASLWAAPDESRINCDWAALSATASFVSLMVSITVSRESWTVLITGLTIRRARSVGSYGRTSNVNIIYYYLE